MFQVTSFMSLGGCCTRRIGADYADRMQHAIRTALEEYETWAVVGCSPDRGRDSHRIAALLQLRGKRVIPINPNASEVLGERAYSSLHELPPGTQVDVVDIFRRSNEAGAHVDEAIAIGARAVWMQLGVIEEEAAARARAIASGSRTPSCSHTARAPIAIASSTWPPAWSERRKTSTTSMRRRAGTSARVG